MHKWTAEQALSLIMIEMMIYWIDYCVRDEM